MEARQERGLAIASEKRIRRITDGAWMVPSQRGPGGYVVDLRTDSCTCPDFELRHTRCKHMWAVSYARHEVTAPDGSKVTVETVKITYTQDWPRYNAAQVHEKELVGALLRGLCSGIIQPVQGKGRPRLSMADVAHAATMKVYSGMSGRRASTDVRECEAKGLIGHAPHYNSVHNFMERADVTRRSIAVGIFLAITSSSTSSVVAV